VTRASSITALAAIALLVFSRDAFAYIDPGAGSFVLQAIVGGIAAAIVFAGHVWRRMTRRLRRSSRDDGTHTEQ
jgi:hypothetical protein